MEDKQNSFFALTRIFLRKFGKQKLCNGIVCILFVTKNRSIPLKKKKATLNCRNVLLIQPSTDALSPYFQCTTEMILWALQKHRVIIRNWCQELPGHLFLSHSLFALIYVTYRNKTFVSLARIEKTSVNFSQRIGKVLSCFLIFIDITYYCERGQRIPWIGWRFDDALLQLELFHLCLGHDAFDQHPFLFT